MPCACGHARVSDADVARVSAIDPLVRKMCVGCATSSAMSGILPTIVWPSDVDAYKRENAPQFDSTNVVALACQSLDPITKKAWSDFYATWATFFAQSTPTFGSANAMDQAQRFVEQLADWQKQITARGCALAGPPVTPPSTANQSELDAIKWIVGGVAVVAVVYGVTRFVKIV